MATAIIASLTAFLGSAVESVEALTVVLAVGLTRGWRSALEGTAAGLVVLVLVVGAIGGYVISHVPDSVLKLVVGGLILLFGIRWLRKAVLRAGGALAMHDEASAYAAAQRRLRGGSQRDRVGFLVAFQAVILEGTEVAFIVVAAGAGGGAIIASAIGGAVGVVLVATVGFAVRRPLTRVPENTLKLAVGVALSSLGTFWVLEGMGTHWPLDILSMLPLAVLYIGAARLGIALVRALQPRVAATR